MISIMLNYIETSIMIFITLISVSILYYVILAYLVISFTFSIVIFLNGLRYMALWHNE